MAHQPDKKDERPQGTHPSTPDESNVDPVPSKDPDLYDPVGMAGKKAGIVEKVEEQLKGSSEEEDRSGAKDVRQSGRSGS